MARVPTWTELRLDVTKLVHVQKECYRSIHKLLDVDIQELDKKILKLKNVEKFDPQDSNLERILSMPSNIEFTLDAGDTLVKSTMLDETPKKFSSNEKVDRVTVVDFSLPPESKETTHPKSMEKTIPNHREITEPNYNEITIPEYNETTIPGYKKITVPEYKEATIPKYKETAIPRSTSQPFSLSPSIQAQVTSKKKQKRFSKMPNAKNELDLDDLEHLRPPPLPLSEYLRLRKPEILQRANQRAGYIHNQAERRKEISSRKIIDSFKRFRLSAREKSLQTIRMPPQQVVPKQPAPNILDYGYNMKHRLSEREMKRLTAKTYNQLPEVTKRRKEEITNHVRVQNYKNKLEYGRRLIENRRLGIIDYPLRASCEDASIISSQDDSMNGGGSADAFSSDPYY